MEIFVYGLCMLTSCACAVLLVRAYVAKRVPLLFWSGLCFVGYTLNNALLLLNVLVPSIDLFIWQTLPALAGLSVLVYGLVWMKH